MARAAGNAGNSGLGKKIKAHFMMAVAHVVAKFERVKDCVDDMAKCMEKRRAAEHDVAYKFDSYMIEGHIAEVKGLVSPTAGICNALSHDYTRDNLFNSELGVKYGLVPAFPPATEAHKKLEGILYTIVDSQTNGENDADNQKQIARLSLIARRLNCKPEDAMGIFADFANQSLSSYLGEGHPIENLLKVLICYATFAFIQTNPKNGRRVKTTADDLLRNAFEYDFGFRGEDAGMGISMCHNRTVHYLWTGHDLETAQSRATGDTIKAHIE